MKECFENLEATSVPYDIVFVDKVPINAGGKKDAVRVKKEANIDSLLLNQIPLLKDNIILNNLVNEENNVDNKNINKNIFNNKTNYIKTKKMNHNNSSRNLNLEQINKRINNKRDMSGIYMNEFIRAFNNSKKLRNKFLSLKDNEK